MQVESQALSRAKAMLVKLANPTPPKARAPNTELNQYQLYIMQKDSY